MTYRALAVAAVLVVAAYVAICAAMYFRQRDFIYFPQFTRIPQSQTNFSLESDGVVLRGWRVNAGRRDAIIYFGGNAESLAGMRDALGRWFPGRTSYLVAYRGYGASEGAPSEAALARDALALYDTVRARHPDGAIAVIGRSLGTGVAARLAAERRVAKLVLITPFDSLVGVAGAHYRWLPVDWLMRERFESTRHLTRHDGPILVIRAGRDRIVPPANTDRLVEALPRPPHVVALPHADHIDVDRDPAFSRSIVEFIR